MQDSKDINITNLSHDIYSDAKGMSWTQKAIMDVNAETHDPKINILDIGSSFPDLYPISKRRNQVQRWRYQARTATRHD